MAAEMSQRFKGFLSTALISLCFAGAIAPVSADVAFDFENPNPLNSSIVSGNKVNFATTGEQTHGGSKAIKFVDPAPEPFESWTYSAPFNITSGTITVWVYDSRGASAFQANPSFAKWGGSVILEDAANQSDFGAVEISELPYGPTRYYATEGATDRGVLGDKFDSNSLPTRSVGFHKVEFQVGVTDTIVTVDGVAADEALAPGGAGRTLRLRIMADSATVGGFNNWATTTTLQSLGTAQEWLFYDDIVFDAQLPAVATHSMGFEAPGGNAEYDTAGSFMGPAPFDNTNMAGFVNQWDISTSAATVHSGDNSASFTNPAAKFKSIAFDVSAATPGTTATVYFYDTEGTSTAFDKMGGSIIIENGSNPSEFMAVEIWNAPYPQLPTPDPTPGGANYYLTKSGSALASRKFGNRGIGWHKVEIGLYATHSVIYVDGVVDSQGTGIVQGPGLDKSPRIRLMGDSASSGGFDNYTTVGELQTTYLQTRDPYVYYDDITLPIPGPSCVTDWALFQ